MVVTTRPEEAPMPRLRDPHFCGRHDSLEECDCDGFCDSDDLDELGFHIVEFPREEGQ